MPITLPTGTEIEPTNDQVLCRMYSHTGKHTESSKIFIPDIPGARPEAFFARVIKTGPGRKYDVDLNTGQVTRFPMEYLEGDDIVFLRYHGERVTIDHNVFIILSSDDILAKVRMPEEKIGIFFNFAKDGDFEFNEGNILDMAQANT